MIVRCINIILWLAIMLAVAYPLKAQQAYNHQFALHLTDNNLNTELIFYLNKHAAENDTACFLLAKTYFSEKNFEKSNQYFNQIPSKTYFGKHASYYNVLNLICLNKKTPDTLSYFVLNNDTNRSNYLNAIFFAGNKLYKNDTLGIAHLLDSCINIYLSQKSAQILKKVYVKTVSTKNKNPYVAALLSGLLPGMGKVYGNRPYAGLASFLQNAVLGAVMVENILYSDNLISARPLFFTGLFAVFYAGNIVGSYQNIKKVKAFKKQEINEEIAVALYMLLRNTIKD